MHSSQFLVSFHYEGTRALCSGSPGQFLCLRSICSARENAVIMIVKEINLLLSAFVKQLKLQSKQLFSNPQKSNMRLNLMHQHFNKIVQDN